MTLKRSSTQGALLRTMPRPGSRARPRRARRRRRSATTNGSDSTWPHERLGRAHVPVEVQHIRHGSTLRLLAAFVTASTTPCLLVEGDDRPGLGARFARAGANEGVNVSFVMAETIRRKFSAVFGFANDADAEKASRAIRAAAKPAKPARKR